MIFDGKKDRDEGRKGGSKREWGGKRGEEKNEIQETRMERGGGERGIPWVNLTCSHRDRVGSSRSEGKNIASLRG